ncbi:peroxisome biogenesis factor 2 [Condylostylus longicornis]|uniref:peroxisome biogenesis factor 2 n=1 Tax=Condylostylus longicornis TaxID=2530218 RepID=UPI00244DD0DB|nr:peroxisome biogenesis factor 2 [Condylostylus longicornis]
MNSIKKNPYVSRVNQLDAVHLNKDIYRLIRENIFEALQEISPIVFSKIQPEIDLFIQSAIWLGSVGKQSATFGQQILRLSYDTDKLTKSRLCLHFILSILPQYMKSISEQRLTGKYWIQKILFYANNAALVLTVVNFFRFLKNGKKPTLIDVLLGLDYVTLEGGQKRNLGYDFMTRELIWGIFMELIGLIVPMINLHKIKRICRFYIKPHSLSNIIDNLKAPEMNLETTCAYCKERPTLPHYANCKHIFCYYCLHGNFLTDSDFTCPICDIKVEKIIQFKV